MSPTPPVILLQAALKTDKESWEGIPGSFNCPRGLGISATTRRGRKNPREGPNSAPENHIPLFKKHVQRFYWVQALCQAPEGKLTLLVSSSDKTVSWQS